MFDLKVCDNGYAWWYLDAISDDRRHALTIIAFIGSVFSPYYARSRKRTMTDPHQHVAINAILYSQGSKRWSMTERGRAALTQSGTRLTIGPSDIQLIGNQLRFVINEICAPLPRRLRGEINVTLPELTPTPYALDAQKCHWWQPLAPSCRVIVQFEKPELDWQGNAYLDQNWGTEPIETGFTSWDWSRIHLDNGQTLVFYDRQFQHQAPQNLLLEYAPSGELENTQVDQAVLGDISLLESKLPPTSVWRMPRAIRDDPSSTAKILRTLEDTPFYSRSEITSSWGGVSGHGIHESVSLTRLVQPVVQCMLPFRMPRRA